MEGCPFLSKFIVNGINAFRNFYSRFYSFPSANDSTLNFNTNTNFCGIIELIDVDNLKPGESALVKIKMIPAKKIRSTLDKGDAFSIVEGNRKIGTGVIKNVVQRKIVTA